MRSPANKKGPTGPSLKGAALASFNRGKALFHGEAACFGCHAPDGAGILGLGPPLDESEWVTGKDDVFAKLLLHGITGPITVNGKKYETPAEMPALSANPTFTDRKIADIMTYSRNAWSNKAAPRLTGSYQKTPQGNRLPAPADPTLPRISSNPEGTSPSARQALPFPPFLSGAQTAPLLGCDFYRCIRLTQPKPFNHDRADPTRSALIKNGSSVSPERE